jgi:hypothetical protein
MNIFGVTVSARGAVPAAEKFQLEFLWWDDHLGLQSAHPPDGVVATDDLEYLARVSGDSYHQSRADDGIAWLMNTMELYPQTMGYGPYGVLSERTCPSDGLLAEVYYDDNSPSSTWWSYNAWAAGSAMEALAERIVKQQRIASAAPRVGCAT